MRKSSYVNRWFTVFGYGDCEPEIANCQPLDMPFYGISSFRYTDLGNPPVDCGNNMELNEHEQKILDEIERQLYEDDPKLAAMVARAVRGGADRWKMRFAVTVFVLGAIVMFVSFTRSWAIAGTGFLIMVVSASWMALRARSSRIGRSTSGVVDDWLLRFQHRWRRDG